MALVRLKKPHVQKRQCQVYPNQECFTSGSGLAVKLTNFSPAIPAGFSFASGYDHTGEKDFVEEISVDGTTVFSSLPANNTSYLYLDRSNNGTITYGHTIVPPVYAPYIETSPQALLHFEGADTSNTFDDDFDRGNNRWSAAGNAQIDTAQFKFGSSSVLLDGTGDYVELGSLVQIGKGSLSWTTECWVRWNSLPGTNTTQTIYSATNAGGFGINMQLNNTSGTTKTRLILSSNGTSGNIANSTLGTKTTWSTGTWYHFALTFDKVAGKYFLYVDGVQDQSITSTAKICSFTKQRIGDNGAGASQMNGWIDEFRNSNCCRYPNGTTFTPSASAFTVSGNVFNYNEMIMYDYTAAETLTPIQRLYVGEAVTDASSVQSLINYAFNAETILRETVPSISTRTEYSHNIGVKDVRATIRLVNVISDDGYVPKDETDVLFANTTFIPGGNKRFDYPDHLVLGMTIQNAQLGYFSKTSPATFVNATAANWNIYITVKRDW